MVSFLEIIKNWKQIMELKEKMLSQCLPAFDKYEESDRMCPRENLIIDLHDLKSSFLKNVELKNQSCLSDELYHAVVESYFTVVIQRCQLYLYDPGEHAFILSKSCVYDTRHEEDKIFVKDIDDIHRSQDIPRFSNSLFFKAINKCHTH